MLLTKTKWHYSLSFTSWPYRSRRVRSRRGSWEGGLEKGMSSKVILDQPQIYNATCTLNIMCFVQRTGLTEDGFCEGWPPFHLNITCFFSHLNDTCFLSHLNDTWFFSHLNDTCFLSHLNDTCFFSHLNDTYFFSHLNGTCFFNLQLPIRFSHSRGFPARVWPSFYDCIVGLNFHVNLEHHRLSLLQKRDLVKVWMLAAGGWQPHGRESARWVKVAR